MTTITRAMKVLITKMVVNADGQVAFYGCTENGEIPDRFYSYPQLNGTDPTVEGYLMQLYSVLEMEGVETWAERNNAEEVEIDAIGAFREKYLPQPQGARWFVDKKGGCRSQTREA